MKRGLLVCGVLALGMSATARPAEAVIVMCANCSTLAEELVSDARQAQQYATEVAQLQTQLNQYSSMVRNSVALPQEVFAGVQSDIYRVRNLTNEASVLTGNSGSILARLENASSYGSQAISAPSQMGEQFAMWRTTLANGARSLGATLGVQQGQETSYTALQAAIQIHSQTAAGQMEAIQAGNELAALTNTQLQQLQTTLTAQAQLQATRDLTEADRTAAEDQAEQTFVGGQNVPPTGYQGF